MWSIPDANKAHLAPTGRNRSFAAGTKTKIAEPSPHLNAQAILQGTGPRRNMQLAKNTHAGRGHGFRERARYGAIVIAIGILASGCADQPSQPVTSVPSRPAPDSAPGVIGPPSPGVVAPPRPST